MKLSERQWATVNAGHTDAWAILADGPVRTGKTFAMAVGFLLWAGRNYVGHTFLMASKSMTQVRSVMVPAIEAAADAIGVPYKRRYNEKKLVIAHNEFLLYDGLNVGSVEKIQGMTFSGAWLSEATLLPIDFVSEVIARCSTVRGSKVWMDMNPDSPRHPMKQRFIDAADGLTITRDRYGFADNPRLTPRGIAQIEMSFTGTAYRRKVLGQWVAAAGQVYPADLAEVSLPPEDPPNRLVVVADGGVATTTHATLFGQWGAAWWALEEYNHNARDLGQLPESRHAEAILAMVAGRHIAAFVVDPAAQQLKLELSRTLSRRVLDANNAVEEGIEATGAWIANRRIRFSPRVSHTLAELDRYLWDPKAAERGESRPVKIFDHAMDVLRYFVMHVIQTRRTRIVVAS